MPYCTVNAYNACNPFVIYQTSGHYEYCMDKCKSACQYVSYNWQITHRPVQPKNPNTTELQFAITPMFHSFPQFSWTAKTSVEQFISQMGGIVNLYLGFSGVSCVAMVIACVDFLSRFLHKGAANGCENCPQGTWSLKNCKEHSTDEAWITKLKEELRRELKSDLEAALKRR